MNKLYYTDPLAAAYMAREFGVKTYLKTQDGDWIMEGSSIDILEADVGDNYYIHPESYHIFEPQDRDWARSISGYWCFYEEGNGSWWSAGQGVSRVHEPIQIIQRDNKPFFWPESEEV